jgi:hypothetical protein
MALALMFNIAQRVKLETQFFLDVRFIGGQVVWGFEDS